MTRVLFLSGLQTLQSGQAVQPGHLQIQQQNVGFVLLKHVEHLPPVLCLGDYFEILFQGQQFAQAVPKDGVIVRHDDPDFGPDGYSCAGRGPVNCGIVL